MTRVRRTIALALSVSLLGVLLGVSGAGAYVLPLPAGSSGGPPTAPSGGPKSTKLTKKGATAVGDLFAGYTASELPKLTLVQGVTVPAAGTIYARVSLPPSTAFPKGFQVASAFAGRSNKGTSAMTFAFSPAGTAYLLAQTGPVTLKIRYVFQSNLGVTRFSTVTIVTGV